MGCCREGGKSGDGHGGGHDGEHAPEGKGISWTQAVAVGLILMFLLGILLRFL